MKRSIKSRLAALSSVVKVDALPVELLKLLLELYGRQDALFWPRRQYERNLATIVQLRSDYQSGRYGLNASAQGAKQWKTAHAARQDLIARGLAESVSSGTEVTGLRLTELGNATALEVLLESMPLRRCGLLLLILLQELEPDRRDWISERKLFGLEVEGNRIDATNWEEMTCCMIPMIVAGAVAATVDSVGWVYYQATGEPLPETVEPLETEELDQGVAWELYQEGFRAQERWLDAREQSEGVFIPLPASS